MIYQVRWKRPNDEREYSSSLHLSTADATDFACRLLDEMTVSDIRIVDGSGQGVIRMPEIARHRRARTAR